MVSYVAVIGSYHGITIITDSESDPMQDTATYPINDNTVAVVYRGKDGVKDFIDRHIIPIRNLSYDDLIPRVIHAFQQNQQNYAASNFSFFIASYDKGIPKYYAFFFNNGIGFHRPENKVSHFILPTEDLGNYLVVKVYSGQMSLDEVKNLTVFITLQAVKVLGYDFKFDITTISEHGIIKLNESEVKDIFYKQEQIDHKLKKTFADFFVSVGERRT